MTADCFHCGQALLGSTLTARIAGRDEPVCCAGCRAVAELIATAGLDDYYRYRSSTASRPEWPERGAVAWAAYARPEVARQFVHSDGDGDSITLAVDGLRCAACGWLVDRGLQRLPGVRAASTSVATGRVYVAWDRLRLDLPAILQAIAQLGYRPQPLSDAATQDLQRAERRDALKRLAVSGFGMMQVMMFAVADYAAQLAGESMDAGLLNFFRIVSLIVATPVMFYAGAPIFASAWNSLRQRTIGMDVPVGAALVLAFAASVWNTLVSNADAVYFDSVTMFIFFVTLGRFVQLCVRHRATAVADALARQLPALAHRLREGRYEDVPSATLAVGDLIQVRVGELLPADGEVIEGETEIDEALLTGESLPVRRRGGERVAAGTLNVGQPISVRVTAEANNTLLSQIVALMQRAQAQKPPLARAADLAAARFLGVVLVGAALTGGLWLLVDPSRAFSATLAVLVVACPCAFAIAMPAALSAATASLARRGVLITRLEAIESLARVDRVVFDKTGTLTKGAISVSGCETLADIDADRCLQLAAALEQSSEHPLARAFAKFTAAAAVEDVHVTAGRGIEGRIAGRRYRIGTADFVAELRGAGAPADREAGSTATWVTLGDEHQALAQFELQDSLRPGTAVAVGRLRSLGIVASVVSGDAAAPVAAVAKTCGITQQVARCNPQQKVAVVARMQHEGSRVAMVGDGVNDAPVLASADVSIAMGRGAALAQASADVVLMAETLAALPDAVAIARRTLRIARQNLAWAAIYNLGALPLAALGYIPPWLAALGMSASSVAVMLNAMRLLPRAERWRPTAETGITGPRTAAPLTAVAGTP